MITITNMASNTVINVDSTQNSDINTAATTTKISNTISPASIAILID